MMMLRKLPLRLPAHQNHGHQLPCSSLLPASCLLTALRGGRERGRAYHARAAASLPEPFDSILTTVTVGSSCLAIFATLAMRPAKSGDATADEDGFQWGVAGAVACIPLFSFVAWVLPALQLSSPPSDTTRPSANTLYYTYSFIYALPLLRNGFDFDAYSLLMLFLCIAHVQAERIVCTEPHLLDQFKPLAVASTASRQAVEGSVKFVSSVQSSIADRVPASIRLEAGEKPQVLPGGVARGAGFELDELASTEELELEQFDRRLSMREAEKQGEQQRQ